jgi:hypothetical protein
MKLAIKRLLEDLFEDGAAYGEWLAGERPLTIRSALWFGMGFLGLYLLLLALHAWLV